PARHWPGPRRTSGPRAAPPPRPPWPAPRAAARSAPRSRAGWRRSARSARAGRVVGFPLLPDKSLCGYHNRRSAMASHTKWANIQHVTGRAAKAASAPAELRGPAAPPPGAITGAPPIRAAEQPVRYEGYGPGGAAVLVECITDDRNRTRADLRRAFSEHGGHLGAEGSVSYLFNHVGLMTYPPGTDEERLMHAALEAAAEVTERASLTTPLSGEPAERMVRLLEALEHLDDVRNVYSNVEISDEVLARL